MYREGGGGREFNLRLLAPGGFFFIQFFPVGDTDRRRFGLIIIAYPVTLVTTNAPQGCPMPFGAGPFSIANSFEDVMGDGVFCRTQQLDMTHHRTTTTT